MDIRGVAPLLQVFDMSTAIHFYRDVLGFTIWGSSEPGDNCNWAGLRLNGAEVMLNTAYEADQRPLRRTLRASRRTKILACFLVAKIWMQRTGICGLKGLT